MPGQEIGNKNMLAINQHNGIEKNENYENSSITTTFPFFTLSMLKRRSTIPFLHTLFLFINPDEWQFVRWNFITTTFFILSSTLFVASVVSNILMLRLLLQKNIITWNIWIRQIDLYGHKKVNNYVVCFYKDEILQFGLQMVRNMLQFFGKN